MEFSEATVKDIHYVVFCNPNLTHWVAENRKNHIVGIQLTGSAMHDFGYKKFVISRNCLYFLNQKDNYSTDVYEHGCALSIHFTTDCEIDTESFCIQLSSPDELIAVLKKAKKANDSGDRLLAMSFLYSFCAEAEQLRQKKYAPTDKRILGSKRYIDTSFQEKNCLDNAIKLSGLTARRFGELFRKTYNITPNRYIVTKKIEYARRLIETNSCSMSEVARQSGFSDIYYFSKVFKKETGISPLAFRKGQD